MMGSWANRGAMRTAGKCSAAALLALLLNATAVLTPASAERLRDALAAAYKFNPRLDAERARLRATDEEVARAKSGYRPTITGSANVGYQRTETKPPSPSSGESHPKGYGVTATQPIFSGFRTLNSVRAAEATVRAGRENLRIVEQSVLLEAVTAYMDVVRDQAIVRLRENNVNVLTRELRATQDRFSVGEVTRTDVAQAEARRAGAVSALDLARANLQTSRATFERVIGHPPSNLVDPGEPRGLPKSANEAVAIGSREAPAVVAALYLEQSARYTVDLVWGELLPTVQVEADYSRQYDSSVNVDEVEATSVTGRVVVPIYEGGEVRARVRQAKQTHVARLQEVEQARTENQALAVSAWSQLVAARAAVESDQVQVNANRTALTGVREEERVGQRTLLDVLNAEQELLNAEVQLATDRRNVIVAAYAVLQAVGRLSAADQSLAGEVYDPEVHYNEVRRKWFGISITRPDGHREHHDLWQAEVVHEPQEPRPAKGSSRPKK
jgi:outer membrane protein